MRKLAAFMWVMGLSYRGIAALLPVFGVGIGRMSAWRDEQVWDGVDGTKLFTFTSKINLK